jgi:kynureninase
LRSPREPEQRGASVVFDFTGAGDVARELNRRKLFCDYRPGAGIRIGPHFYTKDDEIDGFFAEIQKLRP